MSKDQSGLLGWFGKRKEGVVGDGGDGGAGCGARGFLNHSYLSDAVNDPHIMARRHAHGTDSEDVDRFLRRA